MNPTPVAAGIYLISVPTPYAVGPVNCYLVDGPEPVLVDCGPATVEGETALRAGLAGLRLVPAAITRIVLTHHHPDHAGGLTWLRQETTAPLLGHGLNDVWLQGNASQLEARQDFFARLSRYCGVDEAVAADLARRFTDYDRPMAEGGVDIALSDGAELELGGVSWRVLETPGHAGTAISLVQAAGLALVGDTLLERISSNALVEPPYPGHTERSSSLLAYRHTLRRLSDLPLDLILPGHGATFRDAHALIDRRLKAQEDRARRLLGHVGSGYATVSALTYQLFPGLPPDQLFLGLSEVLGHLDLLEEQGLLTHRGTAPAFYAVR